MSTNVATDGIGKTAGLKHEGTSHYHAVLAQIRGGDCLRPWCRQGYDGETPADAERRLERSEEERAQLEELWRTGIGASSTKELFRVLAELAELHHRCNWLCLDYVRCVQDRLTARAIGLGATQGDFLAYVADISDLGGPVEFWFLTVAQRMAERGDQWDACFNAWFPLASTLLPARHHCLDCLYELEQLATSTGEFLALVGKYERLCRWESLDGEDSAPVLFTSRGILRCLTKAITAAKGAEDFGAINRVCSALVPRLDHDGDQLLAEVEEEPLPF